MFFKIVSLVVVALMPVMSRLFPNVPQEAFPFLKDDNKRGMQEARQWIYVYSSMILAMILAMLNTDTLWKQNMAGVGILIYTICLTVYLKRMIYYATQLLQRDDRLRQAYVEPLRSIMTTLSRSAAATTTTASAALTQT